MNNTVLIRGFPKETTQKQVDCISAAFSKNEGHCCLTSVDLDGESLGIVLQFDTMKHAQKVVEKYRKTKFLGYCISAQHHRRNLNNVNYSIPSLPRDFPDAHVKTGDLRNYIDKRKERKGNRRKIIEDSPRGRYGSFPYDIPLVSSEGYKKTPNSQQHRKENNYQQGSCGSDSSPESRFRPYNKIPHRACAYSRQRFKYESKSYIQNKTRPLPRYFARRTTTHNSSYNSNRSASSSFTDTSSKQHTNHSNTTNDLNSNLNDSKYESKTYSVEKTSKSRIEKGWKPNEDSSNPNSKMQSKRSIGTNDFIKRDQEQHIIDCPFTNNFKGPASNTPTRDEDSLSDISHPSTPLHDEPMETNKTDRSPTPVIDEMFYPISNPESSVLESIDEKSRPNTPVQDELVCSESVLSPSAMDPISPLLNKTEITNSTESNSNKEVIKPTNNVDKDDNASVNVKSRPSSSKKVENVSSNVEYCDKVSLNVNVHPSSNNEIIKPYNNDDKFNNITVNVNTQSCNGANLVDGSPNIKNLHELKSPSEESKTKDWKRKLPTSPVNTTANGIYGPSKFQPTTLYLDSEHRKSKKLKRINEPIVPMKIYKGCMPKKNVFLPRIITTSVLNDSKNLKISSPVFTPVTSLPGSLTQTCTKLYDSTVQAEFSSERSKSNCDVSSQMAGASLLKLAISSTETQLEAKTRSESAITVTAKPVVRQPISSPTVYKNSLKMTSLKKDFSKTCFNRNDAVLNEPYTCCDNNATNSNTSVSHAEHRGDDLVHVYGVKAGYNDEKVTKEAGTNMQQRSSGESTKKLIIPMSVSPIKDDEKISDAENTIKLRISEQLELAEPTCTLSLEAIRMSLLDDLATVNDVVLKKLLKEMMPTLVLENSITSPSKLVTSSSKVIVRGVRFRCRQEHKDVSSQTNGGVIRQMDESRIEKIQGFANDCHAITAAVKLLITKNPDLEERLVHSCKDILQELSTAFKRQYPKPVS